MATMTQTAPQMIQTKNDIPAPTRRKMAALLNARLADSMDLYSQAKHAHWNIRGARFLSLHELFDQVAEMAQKQTDIIAERAAQLGSAAHGTIRRAAAASSMPEYPHEIASGDHHVEALATALAHFGKQVRDAIKSAEEEDDADTANIFTDISQDVDKMLWFVESHQAPQFSSNGR